MHRNSIFFSLQELNTILRFVVFLLFVGQHSCFAVKEQGKQLSIILIVKVVVLSAKIISGIHTLAGNCLKLTLCLLWQTAGSSQLLNGKNPSQCFLSLSISLIGTCTSSTLLLYSFCSLICMFDPKPPRQVVDRCLCYTKNLPYLCGRKIWIEIANSLIPHILRFLLPSDKGVSVYLMQPPVDGLYGASE